MPNNYPKLHNAMWPGIVGKGAPDAEPIIPLDTLLELTANAEADGQKFDGVDLFVVAPHFDIDSDLDAVKRMTDHIAGYGLDGRLLRRADLGRRRRRLGHGLRRRAQAQFLTQVRKACEIGRADARARHPPDRRHPHRLAPPRVEAWDKDPKANTALIAETFREAGDIAADHGEFIVAEGEICWGGMHSWRTMRDLLEAVGMPGVVGYQADMAHSMLYTLGYNAENDRILPEGLRLEGQGRSSTPPTSKVADALRPWTLDFHVAQNDGTVFGSGDHEKTGRHCQVDDPNGRLDIAKHAGYWLRDEKGDLTKKMRHICWDGCMFPNAVMEDAGDLERRPRRHGQGPRRPRLERKSMTDDGQATSTSAWSATASWAAATPTPGRTAPNFFDLPPPPGAQGRLRPRRGEDAGLRRHAGATRSVETDWRKLIERKDIDVVDICVPNDLHAEIAIAAAEAGKMVLSEKPLARTAAEGEPMVAAVEKAGVPNIVWYNYRRIPAVTLIKQVVD